MKRFYKKVSIEKNEEGYGIALDAKPVKTPLGLVFAVPSKNLADAIAREWRAQKKIIEPHTMPLTRLANTAIDRTRLHKGVVVEEFMNFARHDLVCYRGEEPEALAKVEAKAWDDYLAWAKQNLGLEFTTTAGVSAVEQPEETLIRLKGMLEFLDEFRLTALHNATTLSGSAILALALWERVAPADKIWQAAIADETFQMKRWGEDREAVAALQAKQELWAAAAAFLAALD